MATVGREVTKAGATTEVAAATTSAAGAAAAAARLLQCIDSSTFGAPALKATQRYEHKQQQRQADLGEL